MYAFDKRVLTLKNSPQLLHFMFVGLGSCRNCVRGIFNTARFSKINVFSKLPRGFSNLPAGIVLPPGCEASLLPGCNFLAQTRGDEGKMSPRVGTGGSVGYLLLEVQRWVFSSLAYNPQPSRGWHLPSVTKLFGSCRRRQADTVLGSCTM